MNFVPFHVGDWEAGTRLLSPTEKGVYIDLLMLYYSLERPLMRTECERMSRAYAQNEKDALEYVLDRFFQEKDGSYHHERCDTEIKAYRDKSRKAAESAKARWHKRPAASKGGSGRVENVRSECESEASAMQTQCERISERISERNADGMLTNNQEPITNNHKEEKKETKKKNAAPKAPKAAPVEKPEGVSDELWAEWYAHKKRKSGSVTQRMLDAMSREADKAGITVAEAMEYQLEKGWTGFEADWYEKTNGGAKNNSRNLHTDPQWGIGVCQPPTEPPAPFDREAFEAERQQMIAEGLIF